MKLKHLAYPAVFALSAIVIERLCHRATDGFLIGHVQCELPYQKEWETERGDKELSILTQNFHYMGKGAQTYVLASEDGKYILKLFKFHHLKNKQRELNTLLQSYKLAFEEAREETGLLAVHLNATSDLKRKISLVDKLGILHKIDADSTHFILQKRAQLVLPTLKELHAQGNLQAAKDALSSLLKLGKTLEKRKLYDSDAHLSKNYGFIESAPILLDCGNLSKNQNAYKLKAGALRSWIGKEWPELSAWFEQEFK